jgi:hypothetical protein
LKDFAVDGAASIDVVAGPGTAVLSATVNLSQATNTDGLAEVDMASDCSSTDVEPVVNNALAGGLSVGSL